MENAEATNSLAFLQRKSLVVERNGWYELESPSVREAIYEYMLDDRALVHARALQYWVANTSGNHLGRLARIAFHAAGAFEHDTAVAAWIALARAAHRRGEHDQADLVLARAAAATHNRLDGAHHAAIAAIDDESQ
jgi:hypothetical protein